MDPKRRKELMEQYENRRPEMGVVALRCLATGDTFLEISKDTHATINSLTARLNSTHFPNRTLLALWTKHGRAGFTFEVAATLKYEDPRADHAEALEEMRAKLLQTDPKSQKVWL